MTLSLRSLKNNAYKHILKISRQYSVMYSSVDSPLLCSSLACIVAILLEYISHLRRFHASIKVTIETVDDNALLSGNET